jgi:hypothetical protein
MSGMTDEVIGTYLHGIRSKRTQHAPGIYDVRQRENREKAGRPIIQRIRLENAQGETCDAFKMGEPMQIVVEVDRMDEFPQSRLGIVFYTEGQRLATFGSGMAGGMSASYPRQPHEQVALHIPSLPFTPGMHQIDVSIRIPSYEGILDQIEDAAEFEVVEADVYGNGVRLQRRHGLIYLTGSCDVYPLEEPIAELQDMRVP